MKKILTSIILITAIQLSTTAQTLTGQAFLQQTVMGVQQGFGLRIQNQKGWGLGLVHQANMKSAAERVGEKYPFYGIEALVPLTKCGNMRFLFTPKAGLVNEQFFIIMPEVETEIKISDTFSAGITAGIRARQSATGIKVLIHL